MTATTYWISDLFIHYWQRPESFWVQSRNHLVFKDIMCIKEIFWWLAIFSHFMTFHHVKLVWKSISKRNRTPYNRANIMPYESVLLFSLHDIEDHPSFPIKLTHYTVLATQLSKNMRKWLISNNKHWLFLLLLFVWLCFEQYSIELRIQQRLWW